ncbi:hypothetical protein RB25_11930 [Herbaspirillum rubrisubalbicans]|nr:hypothetical protein RB25_11930 [Herbaspirillum rubrisubalbicans]
MISFSVTSVGARKARLAGLVVQVFDLGQVGRQYARHLAQKERGALRAVLVAICIPPAAMAWITAT